MWSHKSILGFTDDETVMLDFDNTSFRTVRYWARRAMNWYHLGGFIILESSDDCHHVVFNRPVTWPENMKIVAWVSLLSKNYSTQKWLLMQCIKMASTLRVSPKGEKPSPKVVYREGSQDKQIEEFLLYRRMIVDIMTAVT